jgi:hypothetical protein
VLGPAQRSLTNVLGPRALGAMPMHSQHHGPRQSHFLSLRKPGSTLERSLDFNANETSPTRTVAGSAPPGLDPPWSATVTRLPFSHMPLELREGQDRGGPTLFGWNSLTRSCKIVVREPLLQNLRSLPVTLSDSVSPAMAVEIVRTHVARVWRPLRARQSTKITSAAKWVLPSFA